MEYLEQQMKRMERIVRSYQSKEPASPEAKKMAAIAKQHMDAERKKYNEHDVKSAEAMYRRASAIYPSEASKSILDSVITIYPELNRAGCAQLYCATMEEDMTRETLLLDCMKRFSNCYYGDGVQVGPMAMFLLAQLYEHQQKGGKAGALYSRLRSEYPEAVNHRGELLINRID